MAADRRRRSSQRMPSLFERVTNAGRACLHREEPEPPARAAPAQAAGTRSDHRAHATAKLGALDPAERPGAKEEDLLDIPAFLRRQAN